MMYHRWYEYRITTRAGAVIAPIDHYSLLTYRGVCSLAKMISALHPELKPLRIWRVEAVATPVDTHETFPGRLESSVGRKGYS